MQGPIEQEPQARSKRTTFEADASWRLQDPEELLEPEDVPAVGGDRALDELASEEGVRTGVPEKGIYDDWDDDGITL